MVRSAHRGFQEAKHGGGTACYAIASCCYAASGVDVDLEQALAAIRSDVRAVLLANDWIAPPGSLRFLLGKMPAAPTRIETLASVAPGIPADHFGWLKAPDAVVDALLRVE